jgi:plasmid stabilization system protein ParE
MAYKIIFSKIFLRKVTALNEYLEKEFGITTAVKFTNKLTKTILIISEQPGIGSVTAKRKDVRKIVITEHNKLYYRAGTGNKIVVLAIFDTRQNPKRNQYE